MPGSEAYQIEGFRAGVKYMGQRLGLSTESALRWGQFLPSTKVYIVWKHACHCIWEQTWRPTLWDRRELWTSSGRRFPRTVLVTIQLPFYTHSYAHTRIQMAGEPWLAPFIMSTFLRPNLHTERDKSNFTISLATWNVRGLNAAEKRQQLGMDWAKYHFNLTCLQETKVAASDDLELASGYKLVLKQQQTAKYRGLGFVIAPRLKPFVRRWWYMSDHIAVLNLAIPCWDSTFCQCRVANAYRPTSQWVRENPLVSEQFYAELNSAIKAPARFLAFVCGDFNSKLGKHTAADIEAGLNSCLGAYGMETRNTNGEALANFLAI